MAEQKNKNNASNNKLTAEEERELAKKRFFGSSSREDSKFTSRRSSQLKPIEVKPKITNSNEEAATQLPKIESTLVQEQEVFVQPKEQVQSPNNQKNNFENLKETQNPQQPSQATNLNYQYPTQEMKLPTNVNNNQQFNNQFFPPQNMQGMPNQGHFPVNQGNFPVNNMPNMSMTQQWKTQEVYYHQNNQWQNTPNQWATQQTFLNNQQQNPQFMQRYQQNMQAPLPPMQQPMQNFIPNSPTPIHLNNSPNQNATQQMPLNQNPQWQNQNATQEMPLNQNPQWQNQNATQEMPLNQNPQWQNQNATQEMPLNQNPQWQNQNATQEMPLNQNATQQMPLNQNPQWQNQNATQQMPLNQNRQWQNQNATQQMPLNQNPQGQNQNATQEMPLNQNPQWQNQNATQQMPLNQNATQQIPIDKKESKILQKQEQTSTPSSTNKNKKITDAELMNFEEDLTSNSIKLANKEKEDSLNSSNISDEAKKDVNISKDKEATRKEIDKISQDFMNELDNDSQINESIELEKNVSSEKTPLSNSGDLETIKTPVEKEDNLDKNIDPEPLKPEELTPQNEEPPLQRSSIPKIDMSWLDEFKGKVAKPLSPSKMKKFQQIIQTSKQLDLRKIKLPMDLKEDIALFEQLNENHDLQTLDSLIKYVGFVGDTSVNAEEVHKQIAALIFDLIKGKFFVFGNGVIRCYIVRGYRLLQYVPRQKLSLHESDVSSLPDTDFYRALLKVLLQKITLGAKIKLINNVAIIKENGRIKVINGLSFLK